MVSNNFTRKDLSNKIHKNVGFSKNLSLKIVDDFFESIILEIIPVKVFNNLILLIYQPMKDYLLRMDLVKLK